MIGQERPLSPRRRPTKLVHHFNSICEHPAGSDLIFCTEDDSDEGIEW
ncbi:bacteriocin immunity protein [Pseudomonas paeninsulae]|nr:bacteriocin immunity protein [Pseudomonas sp. IT1137]